MRRWKVLFILAAIVLLIGCHKNNESDKKIKDIQQIKQELVLINDQLSKLGTDIDAYLILLDKADDSTNENSSELIETCVEIQSKLEELKQKFESLQTTDAKYLNLHKIIDKDIEIVSNSKLTIELFEEISILEIEVTKNYEHLTEFLLSGNRTSDSYSDAIAKFTNENYENIKLLDMNYATELLNSMKIDQAELSKEIAACEDMLTDFKSIETVNSVDTEVHPKMIEMYEDIISMYKLIEENISILELTNAYSAFSDYVNTQVDVNNGLLLVIE